MAESLKNKTVKGVFWSSVERISVQGLQFIVMIVMARVLLPEDYGLVGMLSIFLAVSQSLVDSGFTQALVRNSNRTETDNNTVFYFNILVGITLYILLYLSATPIARFYDMAELIPVMKIIGLSIIINSFTVVQKALFTARVDFKTQAKATLSAACISGFIGIALAYNGFGVWSIVVQKLVNDGVNTIMLWMLSPWRPQFLYSWRSFKEMFSFGSRLMLSGLLNTFYENIYSLVIGKVFNAANLGNYTRASQFASFPSASLTGILQRVTYPVLCNIENENDRLEAAYRKILRLSAFIIFPLMLGLSAVSHPLVNLLLGSQWAVCADVLQVLCFSMMWYPIHAINLNLLNVKGRSDLTLKLEILKKIIGILVLCATFPLGLMVMCYGQIFYAIIALFINTHYTGKMIGMGIGKQIKDFLPIFLSSLFMFVIILTVIHLSENNWLQLFTGIIIGSVVYVSIGKIFSSTEYKEVLSIITKSTVHKK